MHNNVAQTSQATSTNQQYNSSMISNYRYGPAQQSYSAPNSESHYGQKQQLSGAYSSSGLGHTRSSYLSSSTAQTTQATPVQQPYDSPKISSYSGTAQQSYSVPSSESHYGQPQDYSSSSQGYIRGSDVSSSTVPTTQAGPVQQPYNSPKTSSYSYGTAQRSYSASSSKSRYGQKQQSSDAYSSSGLGYTRSSYLSTTTAQTTQAAPVQQPYNSPKIRSYSGTAQQSYSAPSSESHYGQKQQSSYAYSSSDQGYASSSGLSGSTTQTTPAAPAQQPYSSARISSYRSGPEQRSYSAPNSDSSYGQKQQTSNVYSSSGQGYASNSGSSSSIAQTTEATPVQQQYNSLKISSHRYGPAQRSYNALSSEGHYGQPQIYSSSSRGYIRSNDVSSSTAPTTQATSVQQPYNSPKISSYGRIAQQSYGAPSSESPYGHNQQTSDVYSSSSKGYTQSSNYVLRSPPAEQAAVEQSSTHTPKDSYKVPYISYSQRTQEYGHPSEASYARNTQMQTSPPPSNYKTMNEPSPRAYARPALSSYALP
ncbi:unnamed protein product [Haemonchus placei]|uniref:ZM domain-containing protein n=1 Tax=Haemonchus placei TaxID=6290 RepID=A0A0N4X5E5_HAEPC|nr:unnamed protein product [Haemonchus placei]